MDTEQLVKEAVATYRRIRRKHCRARTPANAYPFWSVKLKDEFKEMGWEIASPTAYKHAAIKGDVVAKWYKWRYNEPIKDELEVHRVFKRKGLAEHLPEIYAVVNKSFIVEERVNIDGSETWRDSMRAILETARVKVADLHCMNVGELDGVPKVIDGLIDT